jgi:hypothetical protein
MSDASTDITVVNQDNKKQIEFNWTSEHENILIEWADKAMCYRWLHSKNYEKYNKLNTWFTIPVIIMSTLTGTANFAQERVPIDMRGYFSMIVGGVNILAGIITTIQQFLKISELNEAHRVGSIAWDKFYRKTRVELSKSPLERQNVDTYLKNSGEEFDRLMETSPNIDQIVIKQFKQTFEGKLEKDSAGNIILTDAQKQFKELKKPEICDSLESVRNSVYKQNTTNKIVSNDFSSNLVEMVKKKKMVETREKKIADFCSKFYEQYSRQPTEEEIVENLENEQENINKAVINMWVNKFKKNDVINVAAAPKVADIV